jgi:hypothetical protein
MSSNTKFNDMTRKHFSRYRKQRLGVSEQGLWKKVPYGHILPKELWKLNIIEIIRSEFWDYAPKEFKCHKHFHHLNSSQAMSFNLFFPALGRSDRLAAILGIEGEYSNECEFEFVPDRSEGTNFDFFAPLKGEAGIGVEVKYTETGFASAKCNDRREKKLAKIYRPRLEGKVHERFLEKESFFANYQLLRNISFLGETRGISRLVLLFPDANEKLAGTEELLDEILVPEYRSLVSVRYLEVALAAVFAPELALATLPWAHYEMFLEKYVPAP